MGEMGGEGRRGGVNIDCKSLLQRLGPEHEFLKAQIRLPAAQEILQDAASNERHVIALFCLYSRISEGHTHTHTNTKKTFSYTKKNIIIKKPHLKKSRSITYTPRARPHYRDFCILLYSEKRQATLGVDIKKPDSYTISEELIY